MAGRPGRPKDQAPPGHLTVREAARMLEITPSAVRQRIANGSLAVRPTTTKRKERRYYIPRAAVVEALEKDREAHRKAAQGGSVDELAARLDALSERQENFEQTVREFLTPVRDEVPMPRSDKQQHDEKERFRQLLVESLNFLNQDEANTYKHTLARDALREKISSVLNKQNGSKGYSPNLGA
jgi:predicted transcriptional regulator